MNDEWLGEIRSARWLRRHALFAPFGVFAATAALVYLTAPGQRDIPALVQSAGPLVDLGVVLYGMVAVVIERGIKAMFWALEQRRKWREEFRATVAAEVTAENEREFAKRLRDAHEKGVVEELLRELDDARAKRNGA